MANKIQIKRGLQASLPTLSVGEPALTTNSGAEKVYIGTGSGNKEIPTLVGGLLPIGSGGTGQSTLALARNAMGLGNTTGALPVANGGTGTTTLALARNAMGLGNTTGVLPVANGGTGSSTLNSGTVGLGSVSNYGIATQAEAQVGTSNVKYMTPLRVTEAINNETQLIKAQVGTRQSHVLTPFIISGQLQPYTTVYQKLFEYLIVYGGTYRVSFGLRSTQTGFSVYAKLYKNGVSVGTERSTSSLTDVFYTEDISINANDLLQLYVHDGGNNKTVRITDFKILADKYIFPVIKIL